MMGPGETIGAVATLVVFGSIMYPFARAVSRKIEADTARRTVLPDGTAERIARMETALESVALEVERISEGQRFVTKLLAEQRDGRQLPRQLPPGGAS